MKLRKLSPSEEAEVRARLGKPEIVRGYNDDDRGRRTSAEIYREMHNNEAPRFVAGEQCDYCHDTIDPYGECPNRECPTNQADDGDRD